MNIAMLGHSGMGKTTFMASMYGALCVGIDGITVRCKDPEDHEQLWGLSSQIVQGRFPDFTRQRGSYVFAVQVDRQSVCEIAWIDHRGAAAKMLTNASSEVGALFDDLAKADVILVFLSLRRLAQNRGMASDVWRLVVLMTRTGNESCNIPSASRLL